MTEDTKKIVTDIRNDLRELLKAITLSGKLQHGPVAKIKLPSLREVDSEARLYDYRATDVATDCGEENHSKLEALTKDELVEFELPDSQHSGKVFRFHQKRTGHPEFHYEFRLAWDPNDPFLN